MKKLFVYSVQGEVVFNVNTGMEKTIEVSNKEFNYVVVARSPAIAIKLVERNFKNGRVTIADCSEENQVNLIEEGSYNMFGGNKE